MMSSTEEDRDSSEDVPAPSTDRDGPARDERAVLVWRQWLTSMAEDAEAALAAAIAHREMDASSRESLPDSLKVDAKEVDAPPVALFAPLLSVERDPERRERLIEAMGPDIERARPSSYHEAFRGRLGDGTVVYVLTLPLYLDFVQVLACGTRHGTFLWVKHDPIVRSAGAPREGQLIAGAAIERMPLRPTVDELAEIVVSHRRQGQELPEALGILADLF